MGINEITGETVEINAKDGVAFIEQASPLTRLHYFDGQFLRADAFALEQDYHRTRTRLANLAGGWGVVHGLGIAISGAQLRVGAGLGVTAAGNFVLASGEMQAAIADLLATATPAPASGNADFGDCLENPKGGVKESAALAIYEVTVGPVEGQCGNEPVFGKLCESACVSDSRHPWWREGVVLRLRPISLKLPPGSAFPTSSVHLRNRVASGYFAAEPWLTPSAVSALGLANELWCEPAGLYGRDELVLGLLVREAGVNRVLDAWSGRRERMDTQARGYWQGRMQMRPWNVFVAQVLQFQCQLSGVFDAGSGVIKPADDCAELRQLLDKTRQELEALQKKYSESAEKIISSFGEKPNKKAAQEAAGEAKIAYAELYELSNKLAAANLGQGVLPAQRMLINAGFIELPPAGYLPVSAGKVAIEEQLSRMFGEGVALHYHAVRADEIAHLLAEAQHLQRISLTRGIVQAGEPEHVEIFVPDGQVVDLQAQAVGTWWQVDMRLMALFVFDLGSSEQTGEAAAVATESGAANLELLRGAERATGLEGEQQYTTGNRVNSLLRSLTLAGLARTESRANGSYGLTLLTASDPQQAVELEQTGREKVAASVATGFSVYVAGDVGGDPFDLGIGDAIDLKAELRVLAGGRGTATMITGELTLLARKPQGAYTELLVQVDLALGDRSPSSGEGSAPQTARSSLSFTMLRQGNAAAAGSFIVDDRYHDPKNSPVFIDWEETPRRARLSVNAASEAQQVVLQKMVRAMMINTNTGIASGTALSKREQLLVMNALATMPAASSTLGVAAMNTLVAIADATDDAAFLARARRRLFPTLGIAPAQQVQATQDWVMFRRARTHLCPPVCAPVVLPAIEAFQVWHLRVDDAQQLAVLHAALDKRDLKTLGGFKFQRVGILRFRDASTFAEESADRVLAMWQLAQPAPQVVLGRVWETAPATGQGWENHFRLRNMLEQIASISTPPARGQGALAAIPEPPAPLADGALDGGMLVVSMPVASAETRSALLIQGGRDGDFHYPQKDSPRAPLQYLANQPQGTALVDFIALLTPTQPVFGLTLATTKAAPDAGAADRLKAVVEALLAAGKASTDLQQVIEQINQTDRQQLVDIGLVPDDFDEVIFFE
ncbi:MAG TPA: hypothetical protein PL117_17475 [Accumulibacter sp.]|uniref:hypothetical protein n=1 Tax=Accumulibacter sp. TaxID=2053492 RepID=UPI002CB7A7AE|nr:hypothetical protein [Accumulibacter sp.]HRF74559.1 hypothetical protein [Accumulibacter sp.]